MFLEETKRRFNEFANREFSEEEKKTFDKHRKRSILFLAIGITILTTLLSISFLNTL